MKTSKELNFYEGLALQLVKSKNNHKFFLLKFLRAPRGLQKPLILKALPCINSLNTLNSASRIFNMSNQGANYIFALRYLYCFGAYHIKNFKI